MRRIVRKIFAAVLIAGLVIAWASGPVFADRVIRPEDGNGLEIHLPEKTVDTGNLNPGDKKNSSLKLVNNGQDTFTVYIRTNILSENSPRGGRLAGVMTLTIKDGEKVVADDTFREVAKEGNISLGEMAPGSEKTIYFSTDMPENAGNEYQGSSFKASWTFTTQVTGGGGGGGGGDTTPRRPEPEEEELIPIEEEEVPGAPLEPEGGPPEGEPEVPLEEEEVPGGPVKLPKTGERLPLHFYALGLALVAGGVALGRKRD